MRSGFRPFVRVPRPDRCPAFVHGGVESGASVMAPLDQGSCAGEAALMSNPAGRKILSHLLFEKPVERLTEAERADFDHLLSLDAVDEAYYERLAEDYPEEDGDATRH